MPAGPSRTLKEPVTHSSQVAGPSNAPQPFPIEQFDEVVDMINNLRDMWQEEENEHIARLMQEEENERMILIADVDRRRDRERQVPTYLAATSPDVEAFHVGNTEHTCHYCGARYFFLEKNSRHVYTKCCSNGAITLPPLANVPNDLLESLFLGNHRFSGNFRNQILKYNYAFQFASIQANRRNLPGRGPFVYAVQGQILHHISDINVNEREPRFAPLYFLDPEEAVQYRVQNNTYEQTFSLKGPLIEEIERLLREWNPFAREYAHLREVYNRQMLEQCDTKSGVRVCFSARQGKTSLR